MLLVAMERLVESATLELIWPYMSDNGYCLKYNKLWVSIPQVKYVKVTFPITAVC